MSLEVQNRNNTILTTGTLSGLGRHIFETYGGYSWNRDITDEVKQKLQDYGVDTIIHCAFNSRQSVNSNDLYVYLKDNVLSTKQLVAIPHQKFVFVSSVDVYPKQSKLHSEDEVIDLNKVDGIYGITKLMSESFVKKLCPNHLILRCTSLLGKYTRKNSLLRIIEDEPCSLTVDESSRFNYILYPDVTDFIQLAIKEDIQGIYNLASSGSVTLQEVAAMLGRRVNFGNYHYDVGNIDNSKIASLCMEFRKASKEVVINFMADKGIKRFRR